MEHSGLVSKDASGSCFGFGGLGFRVGLGKASVFQDYERKRFCLSGRSGIDLLLTRLKGHVSTCYCYLFLTGPTRPVI